MNKILTISVAAYNVEQYLEQLIESIVSSKYLDFIELLIINDGSSDRTLSIANKYTEEFSNSVFVVDKENGNYGSTVNTSLSIATGKYFKLLDGDDFYDSVELDKLIEKLFTIDIDLVITPYTQFVSENNEKNTISTLEDIEFDKVYKLSEKAPPNIGMWSITYRTQILKELNLQLPVGISYTDSIFSTYPMILVQDYICLDANVYQYRIGREGQTVSVASVIKSIDQLLDVNYRLIDFLLEHNTNQNLEYLENRATQYFIHAEKALLLRINREFYNKFREFDLKIKTMLPNVYSKMINNKDLKITYVLNIIRKYGYWPYWGLYFLPRLKKWI